MALRTRWRPGDQFLVRHKDQNIMVVEKKAGLLCQATGKTQEPHLLGLVRGFLRDRSGITKAVHRLDRTVSGLLVFARTPLAFERLVAQFKEHSVSRSYITAVQGIVPKSKGKLRHRLDDRPLRVQVLPKQHKDGRIATLHYEVLEVFEKAEATLLSVQLETGIRNQIRVQWAHDGHPLLGEKKYLGEDTKTNRQGHQRLFLHAAHLAFDHPINRTRLSFDAELPPDLKIWKSQLSRAQKPSSSLYKQVKAERRQSQKSGRKSK